MQCISWLLAELYSMDIQKGSSGISLLSMQKTLRQFLYPLSSLSWEGMFDLLIFAGWANVVYGLYRLVCIGTSESYCFMKLCIGPPSKQ